MKNVTICFTLIGAKESHEMVASRHIDCRVSWGPTMDKVKSSQPPIFFECIKNAVNIICLK